MYQSPILGWLASRKLVIELFLSFILIVSISLNYSGIEGGAEAVMISFLSLAAFHFVSAYFAPDLHNLPAIIASKVVGIGSSVSLVGILFTILKLTGAVNMLFIGCVSLGIADIVLLVNFISSNNRKIIVYIVRAIIIGGITLGTFLKVQGFI